MKLGVSLCSIVMMTSSILLAPLASAENNNEGISAVILKQSALAYQAGLIASLVGRAWHLVTPVQRHRARVTGDVMAVFLLLHCFSHLDQVGHPLHIKNNVQHT